MSKIIAYISGKGHTAFEQPIQDEKRPHIVYLHSKNKDIILSNDSVLTVLPDGTKVRKVGFEVFPYNAYGKKIYAVYTRYEKCI